MAYSGQGPVVVPQGAQLALSGHRGGHRSPRFFDGKAEVLEQFRKNRKEGMHAGEVRMQVKYWTPSEHNLSVLQSYPSGPKKKKW